MKKILPLLWCSIVPFSLHAQHYFYDARHLEPEWLVQIGGGPSAFNCLTDVGGKKGKGSKGFKDVNWNYTRPGFNFFCSVSKPQHIGISLQWSWGSVKGDDAILKDVTDIAQARYDRNLHFRTWFSEISLSTQIHPLSFFSENNSTVSPYVTTGAGILFYRPQAMLNNVWVDLRPLNTEGIGWLPQDDRKPYRKYSFSFPFGVGISYDLSSAIEFRLETCYHILLTDHLDDVSTHYIDPSLFDTHHNTATAAIAKQLADRRTVSTYNTGYDQRGDPSDKDAMLSCQLKLALALGRRKN